MSDALIIARYLVQTRWLRRLTTRPQIERLQTHQLKRHIAFLRKHSPYYAHFGPVTSIDDLSHLPIIDKATMMREFDSMNTLGLQRDEAMRIAIQSERTRDFSSTYRGVSVGLSSGTSGHRGLFVISDRERCAWAGAVLAKFLPLNNLFGHRVAFFLRANNNLYETVNSRFITFRYFDIYKNMDEHIRALAAYQPTILIAPPSVLGVIAQHISDGTLTLHPTKVISVAEVLTRHDERRFKQLFQQNIIHQAYQCTEGFLAYTCNAGSLHLNEDIVYIEKQFLDTQRFVPIITDFRRTSQPIVRYRLNDVLVLSKQQSCPCGSAMTIIDRIEGREDDIFEFTDPRGQPVTVFPDMIGRCMLYVKTIQEYRVVQLNPSSVVVYLDKITPTLKKQVTTEFAHLAKKIGFIMPEIQFKPYVHDLSKKLKRIERRRDS